MPMPILLMASIDPQAATIIHNILSGWERRDLPPEQLGTEALPSEELARVGLVVVQSRGDLEELVGWCAKVRKHPMLRQARLLVALDVLLATQFSTARAAGADQCLMVPASAGHVAALLENLLGEDFPS